MGGRSLVGLFKADNFCTDSLQLLHWHHLVLQFHQPELLVGGTHL